MLITSKITPPKPHNIIDRHRLYELLDETSDKPLTFISASAGSGKTTLVSSYLSQRKLPCLWYLVDSGDSDLASFFYHMGLAVKAAKNVGISKSLGKRYSAKSLLPLLTSEYLAGIPTFTKRYFEALFSYLTRLKSSKPAQLFALVFDNYQEVSSSQFHEMLCSGIDVMPEGFRVIVISRTQPPSEFVRFFAKNQINLIQDSDMRFTIDETKNLSAMRLKSPDSSLINTLFEKTKGWAAGMVLMMEINRLKGDVSGNFASEAVFDYFATEIFNKSEQKVKEFLLKTAFLPTISVSLSEKLTGLSDAKQILLTLHHHHYFTDRLYGTDEYMYHPLFREFLLKMARRGLDKDDFNTVLIKTASLLEQSGQIEDAARLYQDAEDIDSLCKLIINNASSFILQGRNNTLLELITSIPEHTIHYNPWLLYWLGMCYFPTHMPASRKYLEYAFKIFNQAKDSKGIYMSWSGLIDTYAFGLDEWKPLDSWIEVFEGMVTNYKFPSDEIELIASSRMLMALTLRKTDKPALVQKWLHRLHTLLQKKPSFDIQIDTIFAMSIYYLWKGLYDKNEMLLDKASSELIYRNPTPFLLIKINLMRGIHYWIRADYNKALETLSEGLKISAQSGVHVFDSLLWSFKSASLIARCDKQLTQEALQAQINSLLNKERTLDIYFYHINTSWYYLIEGNAGIAKEYLQNILPKTEKMGTPYYKALWHIGMAQIELALGKPKDSLANINKAYAISDEMKSHILQWYSLLVSSHFYFVQGSSDKAIDALKKCFALGREYGYVHLEFYQPDVMRLLFSKALDNQIEVEYVKSLIKKLGLYPIEIRTLGRFEVIKDGKPIDFVGRVKQKPLQLLKALISFGGTDIPDAKLMDALWPDADGDKSAKSLKFALHELRDILGSEKFISLQGGLVSLNKNFCTTDIWQVEELLKEALQSLCVSSFKEALNRYKGDFLSDDKDYPYTALLRERIKRLIIKVADRICLHLERSKADTDIVDICLRVLELDNLQEEFYLKLMNCYIRLGRHADAVLTYRRCKDALMSGLSVEPSQQTKEVYKRLLAKG